MHGLPDETYNKIKSVIEKYANYEFKLFGSRAKGNYHASSDIDIAILGNISKEDEFLIQNEFDKIDTAYKIDIVFVAKITKQALINSIMQEGVDF